MWVCSACSSRWYVLNLVSNTCFVPVCRISLRRHCDLNWGTVNPSNGSTDPSPPSELVSSSSPSSINSHSYSLNLSNNVRLLPVRRSSLRRQCAFNWATERPSNMSSQSSLPSESVPGTVLYPFFFASLYTHGDGCGCVGNDVSVIW